MVMKATASTRVAVAGAPMRASAATSLAAAARS